MKGGRIDMGFKLYKTRLKCLFRDRHGVMVALFVPLLLTIVYYLVFNNLDKVDMFETIDIAVVETDSQYSDIFLSTIEDVVYEKGTKIFNIQVVDEKTAEELLDNNDVSGYILMKDIPELVVKESNIKSMVTKNVIDTFLQMSGVADRLKEGSNGNELDYETASEDMLNRVYYLSSRSNSDDLNQNYTITYFYALVGMICIYGVSWGLRDGVDISASLSAQGARINVSPYNKIKLLFINLMASLTVQIISVLTALSLMIFILNIEFGTQIHYVILTCFIGSFIGLLVGCAGAFILKGDVKKKGAVIDGIIILWGFLAGFMIPNVKYLVSSSFPILQSINPVYLIADSLYSLYYYTDLERYTTNTILLVANMVFYIGIITLCMRRKKNGSV